MERYTHRDENGVAHIKSGKCYDVIVMAAVQKLARLEDIEEQGRMFIFPVPLGTPVYRIVNDCESCDEEADCDVCADGGYRIAEEPLTHMMIALGELGNSVFITKDAAQVMMASMAEQRCRVCGCTQNRACPGGCYWVAPGLCSRCAELKPREEDADAKTP